jgi:amino acid transporter
MVTGAVGVQDKPATFPDDMEWSSDYKLFGEASFVNAITAICALLSAFGGVSGFFSIAAEMREPQRYNHAVFMCQAAVTLIYLVVGCLMYYYCGSYVASPALGSAGPTMKIASYAVALPGLVGTITLVAHVSRYLRALRSLTR